MSGPLSHSEDLNSTLCLIGSHLGDLNKELFDLIYLFRK